MVLDSLIGDIYRSNQQLPLAYGDQTNKQFSPYYAFLAQQANQLGNNQGNIGQGGVSGATSLGNASLGLYGQLAGLQQQQQQFNSLAPVLGSLLNQFGGPGGFNLPAISAIGDPMAGYQGATSGAYGQLGNFMNTAYGQNDAASKQFGQQFEDVFNRQAGMMPQMPATNQSPQTPQAPAPQGGSPMPGPPLEPHYNYPMQPTLMQYQGYQPGPQPSGLQGNSAAAWTRYESGGNETTPVQWEMDRVRAEQSGGQAPAPLMHGTRFSGFGAGKMAPYRPTPQQQGEARKNLVDQARQEAEMRRYKQPPSPGQYYMQ